MVGYLNERKRNRMYKLGRFVGEVDIGIFVGSMVGINDGSEPIFLYHTQISE